MTPRAAWGGPPGPAGRPGRLRCPLSPETALLAALLAVSLLVGPAQSIERKPRERIEGTVVGVGDGDALAVELRVPDPSRPRVLRRWVRIARVDAPEMAARNKSWPEQPGAIGAREALAALALGRRVSCEVVGHSYERPVALCERDDGLDVSAEMVERGWGWADPDHGGKPLLGSQVEAVLAERGLWARPRDHTPVPPWCWRRPWAKRCARVDVPHAKGRG